MQYLEAQKEIFRAQDIIRVIDRQRFDAEKEAVEARTRARTLNQQIMVQAAMEEGRKMGLEEGLKRGRALALQEAEMMSRYADDEGDEEYDDNQADYYPQSIRSPPTDNVQEPPAPERAQAPPDDVPPTPRPLPSPPPPEPTPVPPPIILSQPQNRPDVVYHSRVDIPPDGWVPELGTDAFIHIPPPHELSPMLATVTLEPDPVGSVSGRRSRSPGVPDGPAAPSVADHSLRHQPSWASDSRLE